MTTGRKITFWALLLALPLVAALIGLYVVSYATIQAPGVSVEGDYLLAYDPEMGFVPRPESRSKRTEPASANRQAVSFNLYTDARSARMSMPGESSPAPADIVTIGCSFTWGYAFENQDTYATKVAERLDVPGVNFAMGSYGTVQALQMLRKNRDLSPKLVVYGFITDHLRRNVTACAPSPYPFCLDVSHVSWDAEGRPRIAPPVSDGVTRLQLQMKAQDQMLDPLTWVTHGVDVVIGRLIRRWSDSHVPDEARQESALAFLLEEMSRTAGEIGAKLLIVYIPTDYNPPPPALLRSIAKLDVSFLDLTAPFLRRKEMPGSAPLYIPGDGHPSVAGHALIAEEIVEAIRRERLLDQQP